jgi:hypothetical protein
MSTTTATLTTRLRTLAGYWFSDRIALAAQIA